MFLSEVQKHIPCGLRILAPRQTRITLQNSRHDIREVHDRQHLRGQNFGHHSKIQPRWRETQLSFYHTNLSQLPLSEGKIVTPLFSCLVERVMCRT